MRFSDIKFWFWDCGLIKWTKPNQGAERKASKTFGQGSGMESAETKLLTVKFLYTRDAIFDILNPFFSECELWVVKGGCENQKELRKRTFISRRKG